MKKTIMLALILIISVSVFAQEDWTEDTPEKVKERVEKKFKELCPIDVEENRVCCVPDVSGLLNEQDSYAHFKYDHCYPNYIPSDCAEVGTSKHPASCEGVPECQKICCAIPLEERGNLPARPFIFRAIKSDFSYEPVIQNYCDLVRGNKVPDKYCEPSCCQRIDAEGKRSYDRAFSMGECIQGGGTSVDNSLCNTVCCKYTEVSTTSGYYSEIKAQEINQGDCAAKSGTVLEKSMCEEKLCCEYYDEKGWKTVKVLPKGACAAYQGNMKGEPEEQEFLTGHYCEWKLFEDICCNYKTEEGEGKKWMNGAECEKLREIEGVYSVAFSPDNEIECNSWKESQTFEGEISFPRESSEVQTPPASVPEEQVQQPIQVYEPPQTSDIGKCIFNPDYIYPKLNPPIIEQPSSPRINQDRINEGSEDIPLDVGEATSYNYEDETKCFRCIRYVTKEGRESNHIIEIDCSGINEQEPPKVVERTSESKTLYEYFKGFFNKLFE